MLANQRLATSKLAVKPASSAFAPVDYEGDICLASQTVGLLFSGDLAVITQSVELDINFSGDLCSVSQSVVANYTGDLAVVSQSVTSAQQQYPFSADVAFDDFGTFGIRIVSDGVEIPICDYMDSIQITFEEDKAAIAKMTFKQNTGERVELYRHLNKQMRIELTRPNKPAYVLYEGKFDASTYQIGDLWIQWDAVAPRERQFEKMTDAQISAIGAHDVNVFRKLDEYDDKKSLVNDRLSTIPASLDFINGNPVITSWMPKQTADYTLGACDILRLGASNSVLSQENIINKVVIKLQHQWDLLYHVERGYYFNSGYSVCDYSTWGLPPTNATVKSAAQGTGWVMSNYSSKGLHQNGIYYCSWRGGNPAPMWWNPRGGNFQPADKDDPDSRDFRSVVDYTNVYAQSASFLLSTRWAQPIEEMIEVSVQNSASINRYEERESTLNVTVYQDREDATDRKIKRWEHYDTYKNPSRSGAVKQSNGYWTISADNINKGALQAALNVAKRVAETQILASHRSIEMTLKTRAFAPLFNVTQTHNVDFQHVKGRFKVARIVHTLDLVNKFAGTEVTYKLFSNAENQTYTAQNIQPPRAALNLYPNPTYDGSLGVYTIQKNALVFEDEEAREDYLEEYGGFPIFGSVFNYYKANGLIREETYTDRGVTFGQEVEFQVIADEIEEESTDTMEIEVKTIVEMGIPNDLQELIA